MNYEEFTEQIAELVRRTACRRLAEETEVTVEKILKNNHTVRVALCILEPDNNISPTIYLEPYYENWKSGTDMTQLAEEIMEEYHRNSTCRFMEVKSLTQWETVKEYTACKLIHAEKNAELLADLPHRRFLDCAIVYYLELSDPMVGDGTALIHNRNLDMWQITEEQLFRQAYLNTEVRHGCRIRPLNQVMRELLRRELDRTAGEYLPEGEKDSADSSEREHLIDRLEEELCCPEQERIYLMTNRDQYFGAITLVYDQYLQRFAEGWPEGFYVIPSSIHEVLLVPIGAGLSQDELQSMLLDVNEEMMQEEPQNFLFDRIYFYDPKKGVLEYA